MKKLSVLFGVLALLLSHVMCGVVGHQYGVMQMGAGYSAPANTAFLLAIPFLVGVGACLLLALYFGKRT